MCMWCMYVWCGYVCECVCVCGVCVCVCMCARVCVCVVCVYVWCVYVCVCGVCVRARGFNHKNVNWCRITVRADRLKHVRPILSSNFSAASRMGQAVSRSNFFVAETEKLPVRALSYKAVFSIRATKQLSN